MGFPRPTLTDNGKQALLKAMAGQPLVFSSIKIGSGKVSAATDLTKLTSLINQIHSFSIVNAKKNTDTIELTATFNNSEIGTDFEFREIGVFIIDSETGKEVLYCYSNCGSQAEKIESTDIGFVEKTIKVSATVGNAENVSVTVNSDLNYITRLEEKELRNSDIDGILSAMVYGFNDDIILGDGYLVIGKNKTIIDENAYKDNDKIQFVYVPNEITKIGSSIGHGDCFYNCANLKKIHLPSTLTHIYQSAFQYCTSLQYIELPDNVILDVGVFANCIALKKVVLPIGISEIPSASFAGCNSLTDITIPSNVSIIGDNAFNHCTSLQYIELPDNVISIKTQAFRDCSSLKKITIKNTDSIVNITDADVFKSTPIANGQGTVIVPAALLESYKTATYWSTLYAAGTKFESGDV